MSRKLSTHEYPQGFELGDIVEFDWFSLRLKGVVVRIYMGSGNDYHVEVDGKDRYEVNRYADNMEKVE